MASELPQLKFCNITIPSTEEAKEKNTDKEETFTLYKITVVHIATQRPYNCSRRFHEFREFDRVWSELYPTIAERIKLPSAFNLPIQTKATVDKRRVKLEEYLNSLAEIKSIQPLLAQFLAVPDDVICAPRGRPQEDLPDLEVSKWRGMEDVRGKIDGLGREQEKASDAQHLGLISVDVGGETFFVPGNSMQKTYGMDEMTVVDKGMKGNTHAASERARREKEEFLRKNAGIIASLMPGRQMNFAYGVDRTGEYHDRYMGKLLVSLWFRPGTGGNIRPEIKNEDEYEDVGGGSIVIEIHSGMDLPSYDGITNPYVKTYLFPDPQKKTKRTTDYRERTVNPSWEESFEYGNVYPTELPQRQLLITVWDQRNTGKNNCLGEIILDGLGQLPTTQNTKLSRWIELRPYTNFRLERDTYISINDVKENTHDLKSPRNNPTAFNFQDSNPNYTTTGYTAVQQPTQPKPAMPSGPPPKLPKGPPPKLNKGGNNNNGTPTPTPPSAPAAPLSAALASPPAIAPVALPVSPVPNRPLPQQPPPTPVAAASPPVAPQPMFLPRQPPSAIAAAAATKPPVAPTIPTNNNNNSNNTPPAFPKPPVASVAPTAVASPIPKSPTPPAAPVIPQQQQQQQPPQPVHRPVPVSPQPATTTSPTPTATPAQQQPPAVSRPASALPQRPAELERRISQSNSPTPAAAAPKPTNNAGSGPSLQDLLAARRAQADVNISHGTSVGAAANRPPERRASTVIPVLPGSESFSKSPSNVGPGGFNKSPSNLGPTNFNKPPVAPAAATQPPAAPKPPTAPVAPAAVAQPPAAPKPPTAPVFAQQPPVAPKPAAAQPPAAPKPPTAPLVPPTFSNNNSNTVPPRPPVFGNNNSNPTSPPAAPKPPVAPVAAQPPAAPKPPTAPVFAQQPPAAPKPPTAPSFTQPPAAPKPPMFGAAATTNNTPVSPQPTPARPTPSRPNFAAAAASFQNAKNPTPASPTPAAAPSPAPPRPAAIPQQQQQPPAAPQPPVAPKAPAVYNAGYVKMGAETSAPKIVSPIQAQPTQVTQSVVAPVAAPPRPNVPPRGDRFVAVATYAPSQYEVDNQNLLPLTEGQTVIAIDKTDTSGWWYGKVGMQEGYFPSSYVKPA